MNKRAYQELRDHLLAVGRYIAPDGKFILATQVTHWENAGTEPEIILKRMISRLYHGIYRENWLDS